ncbi:MAG: aspartate aminotransferase family protein [Chitinophagaceae bacterium]
MHYSKVLKEEESLDPANWEAHRALAHKMVDDVFSFLSELEEQPVWRKTPEAVKEYLQSPLPLKGQQVAGIYEEFKEKILPYRKGNIHPMFFSWVEGNGTVTGVLADMLASAMNSNLGIGDHSAVYVEHQVINWCKEIVGFPVTASGLIVSGGSIANINALIVARNTFKDGIIKKTGLKDFGEHLVVYCSTETHNCIFKAIETIGIGTDYLRKIPVDESFRIDIPTLEKQIRTDRENGLTPFCIVGNAGTVNTGALDPFTHLSAICKRENMWFHVDGAIAAVLHLLPEYEQRLKGMNQADSIAFDLHKWLYINYEAGCVLVRNAEAHKTAFVQQANYLSRHERGLAAGPDSFSSYGLELSRSFKSLKVWMSLKEHGIEKYARIIRQNIAQALYMEDKIKQTDHLELLTPVTLNIVCYRYNPGGMDEDQLNHFNKEILMRMQEQGIAAPSYTVLHGRYSIRLSITNHRTIASDLDKVIAATLEIGDMIINGK